MGFLKKKMTLKKCAALKEQQTSEIFLFYFFKIRFEVRRENVENDIVCLFPRFM